MNIIAFHYDSKDFRVLRFWKFTMIKRLPSTTYTVSRLYKTLKEGQEIVNNQTSIHQESTLREVDHVYLCLKQIFTSLTKYQVQQLSGSVQFDSYDSETSLNLWLRVVSLLSSNTTLSPSLSSVLTLEEDLRRNLYDQYTCLSENILEVLNIFEKDFHTLSLKLKSFRKSFKKYIDPLISNSGECIISIKSDFFADQLVTSTTSEDSTNFLLNADVLDGPNSEETCILTIIRTHILLEYKGCQAKLKPHFLVLPVKEGPDRNFIFLEEFIKYIITITSNSKTELLETSKFLAKVTPRLDKFSPKLLSALERQRKKGRLRRSNCSSAVKKGLYRVDSTIEKIFWILEDIPFNLKRILGVADYYSRVLKVNDTMLTLYRKNTTFLHIPWYRPFEKNKRMRKFRDEALFDGEDLLNDFLLNEKRGGRFVQLQLPCTPQLFDVIRKSVEMSDPHEALAVIHTGVPYHYYTDSDVGTNEDSTVEKLMNMFSEASDLRLESYKETVHNERPEFNDDDTELAVTDKYGDH